MNENAKKWVAALRSGKYKQGRNLLKREGFKKHRFCCLGLACELAKTELNLNETPDGGEFLFNDQRYSLPDCVRDWLGLRTNLGQLSGRIFSDLAEANDDGMSFQKIADIIESEPEGLFIETCKEAKER